MTEAQLEETESGLRPAGDGWFVVNARDARWTGGDPFGAQCAFEVVADAQNRSTQDGIDHRLLEEAQMTDDGRGRAPPLAQFLRRATCHRGSAQDEHVLRGRLTNFKPPEEQHSWDEEQRPEEEKVLPDLG